MLETLGIKHYDNSPSLSIRRKLDELCNGKKYPFDDSVKYREVFFPEFKHELKIIAPPPSPANQYNCFAYALGLSQWVRTYTFNQAILNKDLKETDKPTEGDIAVYFSGKLLKHAGKYKTLSEVISKWAGGPVFQHKTFMCPATYGDLVRYFKAASVEEAQWIFKNYPVLN